MGRGAGLTGAAHREIRARSFGSGRDNPCGLAVRARRVGSLYRAIYRPKVGHMGFPSALLGGITAALLDEVMAYPASRQAGRFVATRSLEVWYDRPVPMDVPIVIDAWLEKERGRTFFVAGCLYVRRGEVLARARARYRQLPDDKLERFLESRAPRKSGSG